MRIAFMGKGGSGKTTVASAYILYLSKNNLVTAIDADHNSNLQRALGINGVALALSDKSAQIRKYLAGSRNDLEGTTTIDTTPPSLKSNFFKDLCNDPYLTQYSMQKNNIVLYTVGSYQDDDKGVTCYHGKLGILSNILSHTLDTKNEYIVIDSTAGKDTVGTPLYFAYDMTIFVVEPTHRSLNIYLEYKKLIGEHYTNIYVIVNKYEDEDEDFIANNIESDRLLGIIKYDSKARNIDDGDSSGLAYFAQNNSAIFDRINQELLTINRDWDQYYKNLLEAHKKLALEWYDSYYQQPISKQLDPNFTYPKAIDSLHD